MKYVTLLDPIKVTLTQIVNGKEVVEEILLHNLGLYEYLSDTDIEFNRDLKGTKSSIRIDTEIRKAKKENLKVLTLDDEDWKRLKKAAEEPSNGYPLRPAKRIKPFIDTLIEASDSPPAVMPVAESCSEDCETN